jgi:hypothetical protein
VVDEPWESADTTERERDPIAVRATDRKEVGTHAAARGSMTSADTNESFMVQ